MPKVELKVCMPLGNTEQPSQRLARREVRRVLSLGVVNPNVGAKSQELRNHHAVASHGSNMQRGSPAPVGLVNDRSCIETLVVNVIVVLVLVYASTSNFPLRSLFPL